MDWTRGWCDVVSEQEIADAKAIIGRDGMGCEPAPLPRPLPASGNWVQTKEIDRDEDVVAVLTGNLLKDPDYTVNYHQDSLFEMATYRNELIERKDKIQSTFANSPIKIKPDKGEILRLLALQQAHPFSAQSASFHPQVWSIKRQMRASLAALCQHPWFPVAEEIKERKELRVLAVFNFYLSIFITFVDICWNEGLS